MNCPECGSDHVESYKYGHPPGSVCQECFTYFTEWQEQDNEEARQLLRDVLTLANTAAPGATLLAKIREKVSDGLMMLRYRGRSRQSVRDRIKPKAEDEKVKVVCQHDVPEPCVWCKMDEMKQHIEKNAHNAERPDAPHLNTLSFVVSRLQWLLDERFTAGGAVWKSAVYRAMDDAYVVLREYNLGTVERELYEKRIKRLMNQLIGYHEEHGKIVRRLSATIDDLQKVNGEKANRILSLEKLVEQARKDRNEAEDECRKANRHREDLESEVARLNNEVSRLMQG